MPEYIIDSEATRTPEDWCRANCSGEVVRCKYCKHYDPEFAWAEGVEPPTCTLGYALSHVARDTRPDGYCAWGERKERS